MGKKYLSFFILLLMIPLVSAYYNSEGLTINLTLSSEVEIIPSSENNILEKVTANLSFFPQDYFNQKVLSYETIPDAIVQHGVADFTWNNPRERILPFKATAMIKTSNQYIGVRTKVPFPLIVPEELLSYTNPSEKIDSDNKDIIRLSSKLAQGEDDLFVVVETLGDWIKDNIEYSITTSTLEANQNASWVLANKYGLCDEITNLFIAMCRSVGIPAKFISGIAYTTSDKFSQPYGSHAWAEVYFPGYGWVPFDITYEEFGYVDPTHVKLIESIDSNQAATNYQWIGKNIDIKTKKLDISASIIEKMKDIPPSIKLSADILEKVVGFDSYNLVILTLTNLRPFYLSTQLSLSKPPELEVIGNNMQTILLKPNEKKTVYWKVKLSNLDNYFIYEFPLIIYSSRNESAITSFTVSRDSLLLSSIQIDTIMEQNKDETKKVYSREVDLNCFLENDSIEQNQRATAICSLKNIGNVFLEDINVCLKDYCKGLELGISQSAKMAFALDTSLVGKQKAAFTAKNHEISKATYLEYDVLDEPSIEIKDLEFPREVEFGQNYSISFTLSKKSFSTPKNIEIILMQKGFKQKWQLNQLVNDYRIAINLIGRDFTGIENTFNLAITYNEGLITKEDFMIKLKNPTFFQRVRIFLNEIAAYVVGKFT